MILGERSGCWVQLDMTEEPAYSSAPRMSRAEVLADTWYLLTFLRGVVMQAEDAKKRNGFWPQEGGGAEMNYGYGFKATALSLF